MGTLSHHFMSLFRHAHYSLYLIQGAKLLLFPEITKYFPVFFRNIGDLDVCVYINKVENDLLEW